MAVSYPLNLTNFASGKLEELRDKSSSTGSVMLEAEQTLTTPHPIWECISNSMKESQEQAQLTLMF